MIQGYNSVHTDLYPGERNCHHTGYRAIIYLDKVLRQLALLKFYKYGLICIFIWKLFAMESRKIVHFTNFYLLGWINKKFAVLNIFLVYTWISNGLQCNIDLYFFVFAYLIFVMNFKYFVSDWNIVKMLNNLYFPINLEFKFPKVVPLSSRVFNSQNFATCFHWGNI